MSKMLEAALKIAERGLAVFPCHVGRKDPLTPHGFKDATANPPMIRQWWIEHPLANVAIPTGAASGLVVLDVDMDGNKGIDGLKSLGNLTNERRHLPTTLTVRTPRGGCHYYFQHPGGRISCSTGRLGVGLDLRGDGGYVLVPPSQTEAGRYRYLTAHKPAPLPAWLHELISNSAEQSLITHQSLPSSYAGNGLGIPPSVRQWIESGTAEGDRNARAFWIATQLRDEGNTEQMAVNIVLEFAARCQPPLPEAEARAAVASAFKQSPRGPARNPNRPRVESVTRRLALPAPLEWQPMPDVLPAPFCLLVRAGADAIGVDAATITLPLLAAAASAVGNARRIELKRGWCEPSVLWSLLVLPSGERKSPAMELAVAPLQEIQDRNFQRHRLEISDWKAEVKLAKQGGAELPPMPVCVRHIVKDTSLAALAVLLEQNPRGLLLARDELSAWLGGFGRFDQGEEAAHWLEMHRAGPVTVDRKTGDPRTIHIPHAAVSITGTIQPGTLARLLEQKYFDNGLAARLLCALPPSATRKWSENTVNPEITLAVQGVFTRLLAMPFASDGRAMDLPLSSEAKILFVDFFNAHGASIAALSNQKLRAAYSKLEGYAARLALVAHCVRMAARDTTLVSPDVVDAKSMDAGIRLAQWFKDETRRIYDSLAESTEDRDIRAVVELAKAKGVPLSIRDLMRTGPCLPNADHAAAIVNLLVGAGHARWISEPGKQGKNRERFALTTALTDATVLDGGNSAENGDKLTNSEPTDAGLSVSQSVPVKRAWRAEL